MFSYFFKINEVKKIIFLKRFFIYSYNFYNRNYEVNFVRKHCCDKAKKQTSKNKTRGLRR